jgi:hypothetical protein
MPVTATLKLPECADEQAWEIARGLGWDYYVLRKKWLAFAQAETAKGTRPRKPARPSSGGRRRKRS